jgi:uncharacterized membrane protein YccF (DUF307 family)
MRLVGNIIWFILGGWYIALLWLLGALVFAVSIIGLPFTRSAIEMAKLSAFPFGMDVVHIRDLDLQEETPVEGLIGFLLNIIWACTFGLALFFAYLVAGVLSCMTIILIPFGLQSFKLAALSLFPVGQRVVPIEVATMIREEKARMRMDQFRR